MCLFVLCVLCLTMLVKCLLNAFGMVLGDTSCHRRRNRGGRGSGISPHNIKSGGGGG